MTSGGGGRVQKDGITGIVYGEVTVWVERSKIRGGISKQIGKKIGKSGRGIDRSMKMSIGEERKNTWKKSTRR